MQVEDKEPLFTYEERDYYDDSMLVVQARKAIKEFGYEEGRRLVLRSESPAVQQEINFIFEKLKIINQIE